MKMKMISMLILLCLMVSIVAACDVMELSDSTTMTNETTVNTEKTTEETTTMHTTSHKPAETTTEITSEEDMTAQNEVVTEVTTKTEATTLSRPVGSDYPASYRAVSNMTAFPDGVLVNVRGALYYFDSADECLHRFCFDENCDHRNWQMCISWRFASQYVLMDWQTHSYSEYDGRFYVMRGEQFCSMATDGTDFRIEYSFGDKGNLGQYMYMGLRTDLMVYQQYVYMKVYDSEFQVTTLYRFDIDKREMVKLSQDGVDIGHYHVADDGLYISIHNKEADMHMNYHADFDLQNLELADMSLDYPYVVFRDDIYYYVDSYRGTFGETINDICSYDTKTGKIKQLYRDRENSYLAMLAVTDDYVYFMGEDLSAVYVYSFQNNSVKTAFDDLYSENNGGSFRTYNIYFLDNGKVLLCDMDTAPDKLILAEVNTDGTFYNCRFVETK